METSRMLGIFKYLCIYSESRPESHTIGLKHEAFSSCLLIINCCQQIRKHLFPRAAGVKKVLWPVRHPLSRVPAEQADSQQGQGQGQQSELGLQSKSWAELVGGSDTRREEAVRQESSPDPGF